LISPALNPPRGGVVRIRVYDTRKTSPSLALLRAARLVIKMSLTSLLMPADMAGICSRLFIPMSAARSWAKGFAGIIDPYADNTASWRIEAGLIN